MGAMFRPLATVTADLTLAAVVARLAAARAVDGIVLFGTTAISIDDAGDYDVLVIVDLDPVPARSGITWVAGRLTDLAFAGTPELQQLEEETPARLMDNRRGQLMRWLATGRVAFDRHGLLGRVQNRLQVLPQEVDVTEDERFRRWDHTNYNVVQSARYVAAGDETYREAFDLRMTYQLADVMVDYFRVRGMVWPGEKDAVRHWNRGDPAFKQLMFACLHEPDRERRFALYRNAVAHALEPVGGVWPHHATSMTPGEGNTVEEANRFWLALLGE